MTNIEQTTTVLLFDWSGTISDDRQLVYETNQRLLEAYGRPRLSLAEWRDGREGWNAGNFLAKELNLPIVELYKQFSELLAKTKVELGEPEPYVGAIEAFKRLSEGRRIEIISSHPQEHLEREVRAYDISAYVQNIRGSVSDKAPVIRTAIQEAGIDPTQILYIGDTVQDIHAARYAGVGIASVTYGYHTEELLRAERPDMLIASLDELASQLGS
ncbi:MAG TPA: HAD family hydrolase [Candidatus Saccharimonadales bacterium]|nr:HAD family hydrolase [Candidatus Saccharimonadales bacterium]